jgi:hypothetical protein
MGLCPRSEIPRRFDSRMMGRIAGPVRSGPTVDVSDDGPDHIAPRKTNEERGVCIGRSKRNRIRPPRLIRLRVRFVGRGKHRRARSLSLLARAPSIMAPWAVEPACMEGPGLQQA